MSTTLNHTPSLEAEGYLDKKQVADKLGISVRTLEAWMVRGYVPFVKIGTSVRFRWSVVQAWLESRYASGVVGGKVM